METIEIYKGIEIIKDKSDPIKPFITRQPVPVIGVLQVGHSTLEDAKTYIDKI